MAIWDSREYLKGGRMGRHKYNLTSRHSDLLYVHILTTYVCIYVRTSAIELAWCGNRSTLAWETRAAGFGSIQ